jgi:hypothetical protein
MVIPEKSILVVVSTERVTLTHRDVARPDRGRMRLHRGVGDRKGKKLLFLFRA